MESDSLLYNNCINFFNDILEYFDWKRLKAWVFASFCSILVGLFVNTLGSLATFDDFASDVIIGTIISIIIQPIYMWYAIYVEYINEDNENLLGLPLITVGLLIVPIIIAIVTSETVDWINTW